MELQLKQGPIFDKVEPVEVLDFLRTRKRETVIVSPDSLRIAVAGKEMTLQMTGGKSGEYPIRSSFLLKLLKWYSFPASAVSRLNGETVASILNDFLLAMKSDQVNVTLEDDEALTITSNRYTELSDLTVIEHCRNLGIESISRNDFVTRLYLQERAKTKPVVGDECGFGFNIFNSETGFSQVSVAHYILRYVCSNGAVVKLGEQEQRRHYGISQEQLEQFIEERIDKTEKTRTKVVAALHRLPDQKGQKPFDALKKNLPSILGRSEVNGLQDQINENTTAYDVFNILTDHAKSLDITKRLRLESLAGSMLLSSKYSKKQ